MSRRLFGLTALLAIALAACGDSDRSEPIDLEGERTYTYTAFAENGTRLLVGTIVLHPRYTRADFEQEIEGTWNIGWAPGADTTTIVGPQVGSGALVGMATEDGIVLFLPQFTTDNTVQLSGIVRNNEFRGDWSYSSIAGTVSRGEFTAND
jgi:hypothetical protein